jgi:hypothetical protein
LLAFRRSALPFYRVVLATRQEMMALSNVLRFFSLDSFDVVIDVVITVRIISYIFCSASQQTQQTMDANEINKTKPNHDHNQNNPPHSIPSSIPSRPSSRSNPWKRRGRSSWHYGGNSS